MPAIDEPVQVAMLFRGQEVRPSAFLWHGHRYEVERILLVHKTRVGDVLRWHFTVAIPGGSAILIFDTFSLAWQLTAIEAEGA